MTPKLGDWTHSDAGPWRTLCGEGGLPHVYPVFGPKHALSFKCWCHPVLEEQSEQAIISHNVAQ